MIDPEKIWSSSQLPTLPMAAVRLLKLSKAPKVEIDDVVKTIKTDPALTARILKATNSSFFGFRAQVNSIDRAVPLLGTSMVTSLGLGFSLIDESMARGPLAEHFRLYWMQSIVQAATAELLSEWTGVGGKSECFQAGLLLDIGQLAMLATVVTEYWPVLETAKDGKQGLVELETESLGINHEIVGLRLAENWNLPTSLRTAIAHHHLPLSTLLQFEHAAEFELLAVAAVAASAGDYFCRANKGPALQRMHSVAAACFQFDGRKLEAFLEQAGAYIDKSAGMFNVSADQLPSPSDLMAQANAQLSDLVIMAQMESAAAAQREQAIEQEKTELQSSIVRLQEKAFRDPLTGVYNRQYFNEAIHHEFALCRRLASPMATIFVDIDHFKQFNDTYGHQVGDQVLRHVAGIMQSLLRECDTLARYGGEEFVVLVSEPSMPGLKVLTERIRAAVEQEKIRFEDQQVSVTVSLGAALAIPGRDEDDDFKAKLIAVADQAMYESKKAGRNRCCVRSTLPGVAEVAQPTTGAAPRSVTEVLSP